MMIGRKLIFVYLLFEITSIHGQAYIYFNDMIFFNNMAINPSFSANSDSLHKSELKAFTNNRQSHSNWNSTPAFEYYNLTYEASLKRIQSGFGVSVEHDSYSYNDNLWFGPSLVQVPYETKMFVAKFSWQYNPINNIYLGLSTGLINYSLLVTAPNTSSENRNDLSLQPNLDAGVLFKTRNFFSGIALKSLNSPMVTSNSYIGKYSLPGYERSFNAIIGNSFEYRNLSICVTALYTRKWYDRLSMSSLISFKNRYIIGLMFRSGHYSAQSIILGGIIRKKFKFYFGYDYYSKQSSAQTLSMNMQNMFEYIFH